MDTKALRQKILDLAIHGKLVPQDPNDEPASVLLERIRAEKERLIKEGKIKKGKMSAKTSDKPHYPFELPEGWVWCYITDVTNKITDGTHNSPINTPKGDFKYITAKNIKAHGIELNNISYVSKNIHNEIYARCNPEKGDILYIKDGATTGVVTLNNLDEQFSLLSSVALIKPNKYISNKYLLYYLQSPLCYDSVRGSMKGVGITRITLNQIEKWELPLPPLSEQERIVCQIENWLSLIDTIEKGKENISIALKQAKSKILDLAIHGKLVPQDPNDEPASELLKRINPKAEITCDNPQYGKLPFKIPNSWEWCRLGTVNEIARGGSPRPIKDYLTNDVSGINWIKIGDTTKDGKYIDSVKEKIRPEGAKKSRFVHKGDFLLTNSMSFGRPYILNVDGCIHDGWLVISPIGNAYTSDFLYYLLSSSFAFEQFANVASGGVVTNLNSDKVADTKFPLPPINEQERIVAKTEELFAQLDKIESSLQA
ncbi:restriction endonuclease subunit S [Segatella sp.]|uniref:restriction endonuclease subunit S n=1 Tax=Segatella sp. TaxID=2974253 RepID=UPI003AB98E13